VEIIEKKNLYSPLWLIYGRNYVACFVSTTNGTLIC